MAQAQMSDQTPAKELFPQFAGPIYDMFAAELAGLTDEQLDFRSDRWGWSEWSIRTNASHVASGAIRWLLRRWAEHDLGRGLTLPDDAEAIAQTDSRWLDEVKYRSMDSILGKMKETMDLCQAVLARETVGSLRSREIPWNNSPLSQLMQQAHPRGARPDPEDPDRIWIDLEYTFRHMYFEDITHLYNIQRLKRAQGLTAKVDIPKEGYWVLADWDRSEP